MSASPAGRFLNLQSRFLLTVVHAADKLGMFRRSFAADDLIATAQKATGFSDFEIGHSASPWPSCSAPTSRKPN